MTCERQNDSPPAKEWWPDAMSEVAITTYCIVAIGLLGSVNATEHYLDVHVPERSPAGKRRGASAESITRRVREARSQQAEIDDYLGTSIGAAESDLSRFWVLVDRITQTLDTGSRRVRKNGWATSILKEIFGEGPSIFFRLFGGVMKHLHEEQMWEARQLNAEYAAIQAKIAAYSMANPDPQRARDLPPQPFYERPYTQRLRICREIVHISRLKPSDRWPAYGYMFELLKHIERVLDGPDWKKANHCGQTDALFQAEKQKAIDLTPITAKDPAAFAEAGRHLDAIASKYPVVLDFLLLPEFYEVSAADFLTELIEDGRKLQAARRRTKRKHDAALPEEQ
jgi:hypothetical protein